MAANAINIFEADAHLTEFSEELHKRLIPDFADYGINLNKFLVTTIVKPDGEPQYEKFKNLHFRQYADIMDAKRRALRKSGRLKDTPISKSVDLMWLRRSHQMKQRVSSRIWVSGLVRWLV